jgi:hypothetical protein
MSGSAGLVSRLAGQGHCRLGPDGLEEQQQRRVPVAPVDREVEGGDHVAEDVGIHEIGRGQHDVAVVGADVPGQIVGEGRVRRGPHRVGREVLGVAREVDGEAADGAAALLAEGVSRHGGHRRGVEPAGEQRAQRDVGDQLPVDDVEQQVPDRGHRGRQVVGVGDGLELPVAALADPGPADGDGLATSRSAVRSRSKSTHPVIPHMCRLLSPGTPAYSTSRAAAILSSR